MRSFKINSIYCRLWLTIAWFVCCAVDTAEVRAAGCQLHAATNSTLVGGTPGTMAQGAWWTVGPVQCVYEYGQFTYYQLPDYQLPEEGGLPCNGPQCHGRVPSERIGDAMVIDAQRQSWHADAACAPTHGCVPRGVETLEDIALPPSPNLAGLLRPPQILH